MKYFFSTACCILCIMCVAQKTIDVDKTAGVPQNSFYSVGGEPFVNVKFVRLVSGSPYFKEAWLKGTGVSAAGITYKAGIVRLNLVDNAVHFLDAAGNEMIATSPLKELLLTDTITGKTYHFIHSSVFPATIKPKQGWYLQLAAGPVTLYQFFSKILSETTPYGSATTEQMITTKDEFYIYHHSLLTQIKKLNDLLLLLHDKQSALQDYIKKPGKNNPLPDQLTAVVNSYNSLQE